jgi:hypothetical protein
VILITWPQSLLEGLNCTCLCIDLSSPVLTKAVLLFLGEVFGEDAINGAPALLRKYDSNWETRMEEKDGFVGLQWKGQPVSFSSLWKLGVPFNTFSPECCYMGKGNQ